MTREVYQPRKVGGGGAGGCISQGRWEDKGVYQPRKVGGPGGVSAKEGGRTRGVYHPRKVGDQGLYHPRKVGDQGGPSPKEGGGDQGGVKTLLPEAWLVAWWGST